MERTDPVYNINQILGAASANGAPRIPVDHVDLEYIQDTDDRNFLRLVINNLLDLEPGNSRLIVLKNTDHPTWYVWAQGLSRPIKDHHHRQFYDLRHAEPGYQAVTNVEVYPDKGMTGTKFVVQVVPYGPTRARLEEEKLRERRETYQRHQSPRRSSRRRSPSPRSRSRSPLRPATTQTRRSRRYKPPVLSSSSDRSSSASNSSNSSSSEDDQPASILSSITSSINPFKSRKGSRRKR